MKNNIFDKLYLLSSKEKIFFYLFIFFNFLINLIDLLGIGLLIPIIKTLISGEKYFYFSFKNLELSIEFELLLYSLILLFFAKSIFSTIHKYYLLKYLRNIEKRLIRNLFKKYLTISWSNYLKQKNSVYIRNIFSGIPEYISKVITPLNMIISEYIWLTLLYLFVIFINFEVAFFILIAGSIIFIFYNLTFKKKSKMLGKIRQQLILKIFNSVSQIFNNFKSIKIDQKESFFFDNFKKVHDSFLLTNYKQKFFESLPRIWIEFYFVLLILISLFFVIFSSQDIENSIAFFGFLIVVFIKTTPSLNKILLFKQNINFSNEICNNLFDEFRNKEMIEDIFFNEEKKNIKFLDKIEFKNVSFSFSDKKLIDNLNFTINKNTINLILGPSGSGKTTLTNLLLGLLDPSNGEIKVDSFNLKKNKSYWYDKSSYVSQDVILLNSNIQENIAFGEEKIDYEKLNHAIKLSGLNKFLENLKEKEKTEISDNSINISGGEKKRIAIARALYKKSDLIILDEPTNGLDEKNIKIVAETVKNLKKITTVIIVTHNKDHFTEYDQIINLEKKSF
tara:strand:- start:3074 stop:4759 length:1686 start_codon:yes stop_codon:yes gene_type:complete